MLPADDDRGIGEPAADQVDEPDAIGHSWVKTTVMPMMSACEGIRSTICSSRKPTR